MVSFSVFLIPATYFLLLFLLFDSNSHGEAVSSFFKGIGVSIPVYILHFVIQRGISVEYFKNTFYLYAFFFDYFFYTFWAVGLFLFFWLLDKRKFDQFSTVMSYLFGFFSLAGFYNIAINVTHFTVYNLFYFPLAILILCFGYSILLYVVSQDGIPLGILWGVLGFLSLWLFAVVPLLMTFGNSFGGTVLIAVITLGGGAGAYGYLRMSGVSRL